MLPVVPSNNCGQHPPFFITHIMVQFRLSNSTLQNSVKLVARLIVDFFVKLSKEEKIEA